MDKKQRVSTMAEEVLARQASARAERTGESFQEALKAVRKTEAGRRLRSCARGCTATRGRESGRRASPRRGPRSGREGEAKAVERD